MAGAFCFFPIKTGKITHFTYFFAACPAGYLNIGRGTKENDLAF